MESLLLKLRSDTPLPCGAVLASGETYGKPVYEVVAFPALRGEGEGRSWRITPRCDEHTDSFVSRLFGRRTTPGADAGG